MLWASHGGCTCLLVGPASLTVLAEHFLRAAGPTQAAAAACRFRCPWVLLDIKPVNALVALAYSPLLRWCLHPPCAGVITPVVLVSAYCDAACDTLSSQSWHLSWPCAGVLVCLALAPCQRYAGVVALICCSRRAGVPASIALASSPFTRSRRCLRRASFITLVALASSHWRCCLQHIVIASWPLCQGCADVVASITLALSPLLC